MAPGRRAPAENRALPGLRHHWIRRWAPLPQEPQSRTLASSAARPGPARPAPPPAPGPAPAPPPPPRAGREEAERRGPAPRSHRPAAGRRRSELRPGDLGPQGGERGAAGGAGLAAAGRPVTEGPRDCAGARLGAAVRGGEGAGLRSSRAPRGPSLGPEARAGLQGAAGPGVLASCARLGRGA